MPHSVAGEGPDAMAVACPRCDAQPRAPCVSVSPDSASRPLSSPHTARVLEARERAAAPPAAAGAPAPAVPPPLGKKAAPARRDAAQSRLDLG